MTGKWVEWTVGKSVACLGTRRENLRSEVGQRKPREAAFVVGTSVVHGDPEKLVGLLARA